MDSFGEQTAEVYEDEPRGDETAAVSFLAELADEGPALELAVGTGRIALPLAARGLRVDGIELSAAMVAKHRAKLADVLPDAIYHMVFVVFNSLFSLLSQDEQVRCFDNVAGHPGRGVRAQLPAPTA